MAAAWPKLGKSSLSRVVAMARSLVKRQDVADTSKQHRNLPPKGLAATKGEVLDMLFALDCVCRVSNANETDRGQYAKRSGDGGETC